MHFYISYVICMIFLFYRTVFSPHVVFVGCAHTYENKEEEEKKETGHFEIYVPITYSQLLFLSPEYRGRMRSEAKCRKTHLRKDEKRTGVFLIRKSLCFVGRQIMCCVLGVLGSARLCHYDLQ